jgi:hypothetical protein
LGVKKNHHLRYCQLYADLCHQLCDLCWLLRLNLARVKAITQLARAHMDSDQANFHYTIAKVSTFLALERVGAQKRVGVADDALSAWKAAGIDDSPLLFSWNQNDVDGKELLVRCQISGIASRAL